MMSLAPSESATNVRSFTTDNERWQAVVNRDPAADGVFFYSVRTTGIYCRTVCASRQALRENVEFHDTCEIAERCGFRPCKRCHPNEESLPQRHASIVAQACRLIEAAEATPSLEALSDAVGVSLYHLHRIFKKQTGVTPKQYAAAHRANRIRDELSKSSTVTEAIYRAGYQSNSRFYESSNDLLGMQPHKYRARGEGTTIRFAVAECRLGSVLVAGTDKGICAVLLGDDPDALTRDLQDRFANADLVGADEKFESWVALVISFISDPSRGLDLPLDIQGTAFQRQVWDALREIPAGSTATYSEIATKIGKPRSVRAVAGACAANVLAVVIPCHRVVRTDGSLSGYRWGVERKQRLIEQEQETA